jgi:uncharacterized cupredoxin-like copper-binding protein
VHLSRTALLLTILGVISLAAASTVGVLGVSSAFDHPAGRFQPACEAPALPGSVVTVTLTNMGMGMMGGGRAGTMRIYTDEARVPAGVVSFRAMNTGTLRHELLVLPLGDGQQPGQRHITSDGTVDESDSLGEASNACGEGAGDGITPGATGWISLNLEPGRYELICNLPGHYRSGMTTLLIVDSHS